jgi:hypothetical protein
VRHTNQSHTGDKDSKKTSWLILASNERDNIKPEIVIYSFYLSTKSETLKTEN